MCVCAYVAVYLISFEFLISFFLISISFFIFVYIFSQCFMCGEMFGFFVRVVACVRVCIVAYLDSLCLFLV